MRKDCSYTYFFGSDMIAKMNKTDCAILYSYNFVFEHNLALSHCISCNEAK